MTTNYCGGHEGTALAEHLRNAHGMTWDELDSQLAPVAHLTYSDPAVSNILYRLEAAYAG